MIRKHYGRILSALVVVGLAFGIGATFEKYRGTDNSRVPRAHRSQTTLAGLFGNSAMASTQSTLSTSSTPKVEAAAPAYRSTTPPASLAGNTNELKVYPTITKGMRTPFDLYRYYGRGRSSFGSPVLPMRFDQWLDFHKKQKPQLMSDVRDYMNDRYNFSGEAIAGQYMAGGKPIMKGPTARLPRNVDTYEQLASMSASEVREQDLFPYKPLAHPLQSVAHMVFPDSWIKAHPEHLRIDVDHDIPDEYLPEFPPPMFLTTHLELGDATNGQEVTLDNFFEIFDGLITPEQMEGLKELLRPSPTTWFNHTDHRITAAASKGVACFDCHVNGHTNGAIELGPDARPNMARLRTDTPTMRGNYNLMQLSSKRSIRSMDHFSEVEEYFDGDPGMQQAIGPRAVKREVTNRMADFNSILDYPPAPKLDPLMRLIPELASEQELRGEKLFHGKAQCAKCHYGPAFVDDYMHDLKVERFYVGRPEGPIKTFPLRGIKDSPPYLHDGRLPTLHDTVEFFNLVLELDLTREEKDDLVAYMLCL